MNFEPSSSTQTQYIDAGTKAEKFAFCLAGDLQVYFSQKHALSS
jgi:hypothetical protein